MENLLILPQKFSRISEIYSRKKNPENSKFLDEKYFWGKKNIVAHFLAQENLPKWASMPKANSASH